MHDRSTWTWPADEDVQGKGKAPIGGGGGGAAGEEHPCYVKGSGKQAVLRNDWLSFC